MRSNLFLYLWLGIFLLFLNGCKLEELSETIVVPEVEDEFYIDLWEALGEENQGLTLQVRTIKEEDCLNYDIAYQFSLNGNRVRASLERILPPDDCDPGSGPAKTEIPIGSLIPGFYDFDIALRNTVNNDGQLTINGEKYVASFDDPAGIIFLHSELYRVPQDVLWGYIFNPEPAGVNTVQSFLSDLNELVSESELNNGYYGHFTVHKEQDQPITLELEPNLSQSSTFLKKYSLAEQSQVQELLNEYRTNFPTLDIEIRTGTGEVW